MENLNPIKDNLDPAEEPSTDNAGAVTTTSAPTDTFSWKSKLNPDLANAPTMQKFDDSPEGLGKAIESHLSLEKLLGHEKVPIPKSVDDVEGHNRLAKALGVPDKAEGYGLADPQMPEELAKSGMTFDKQKFAETVHAFKLTPNQAKGLWKAYTEMSVTAYTKALQEHQQNLQSVVNQLRSEWGDAYETNVDLGQTVINKFTPDKDTNDYLTSILSRDPRAIKFLAQIGNQFAENKVGEFSYKRFSLTPEQAQTEIDEILRDPTHPYTNPKATPAEHERAVMYVNSLYQAIAKAKGQV